MRCTCFLFLSLASWTTRQEVEERLSETFSPSQCGHLQSDQDIHAGGGSSTQADVHFDGIASLTNLTLLDFKLFLGFSGVVAQDDT